MMLVNEECVGCFYYVRCKDEEKHICCCDGDCEAFLVGTCHRMDESIVSPLILDNSNI